MVKSKKKRNSLKIYLSDDERREIDAYAKRIGIKKVSNLIREAMLRLARDPSYDFIFDQGSLFRGDPNRIRVRQRLLEGLDQTLDILEDNNLMVIPSKLEKEDELHDG